MTEYQLRRAHAFCIDYDVDPAHRMGYWRQLIKVRAYFNCYSEPIKAEPIRGAFSVWIAVHAPGAEAYHPDYEIAMFPGPAEYPGIIQDIRALHMMLRGCCPEDLMEVLD